MTRKSHAVLAALACLVVGTAAAQDFPSRPITIVIPYPAGGTSDGQVRMIQEKLGKLLGQPVVVENKAGASGAIAAQYVARSKPDGYTLLYPNTGFLITPLLNDKAGYDPLKDFKPITQTTSVPMVLLASRDVPGKSLSDFLQYARKQPNGVMYASAGTTSFGHIESARFSQMAGIKAEAVPYRGEANTTMALRAGDVQMLLTSPSAAMLGQVQQGNIKLLGVGTTKPSPLLPGTPTIANTIPGFTSNIWFGLLAPAGTPDNAVGKIQAAVKTIMEGEDIRAQLAPTGALPQTSTPAEFAKLMKDESAQLRENITKFNIKAE
ncbi:Bug family tripartite tricarboxylate transporter substrate binding protein [Malikia spinosa]|uniref:Bug family tripartite tricarboxylate transporter substrate binding protein n=1 Tax=Malikia spinosa TaxID=86180 RepID=UPI0027B8D451|nr:tripartite tricarboxylate transporter substrate binding protein [Malikia spinosa]